jgi:hypothetical protein
VDAGDAGDGGVAVSEQERDLVDALAGQRVASETLGRSEDIINVIGFIPVKPSRRAANL